MEPITSKTTVTFNEPIQKVWLGLTEPSIVKEYFFGTKLASDWQVGSRITFSGEWEGKKYEDGGTILEIEEPNLLKYSYWSTMSGTEDKPENYNDITYNLSEAEGVTTLVITQEGVKSEEAAKHSEDNWTYILIN